MSSSVRYCDFLGAGVCVLHGAYGLTVVVLGVPPLALVLVYVPQTSCPWHVTRLIDLLTSAGHAALGHRAKGPGPRII